MYDLASEIPDFAQGGIGAYDTNFHYVEYARFIGLAGPEFLASMNCARAEPDR